jgi:hypothetical protein
VAPAVGVSETQAAPLVLAFARRLVAQVVFVTLDTSENPEL